MKIPFIGHAHVPSLKGVAMAALGIVLVGFAATASGQSRVTANIDFPFVAGKVQCTAGSYDFEADRGVVTLRSTDPKVAASAMIVITRLGRHDKDTGTELIFDKVGGKFILSVRFKKIIE